MTVLTKIPDAPVVYDDLRDTLNANGGSTNNEHKSYFVAAAKVNWAARWKPVPFPKDVVSDADEHWRGKINGDDYNTGRCGVDYPTYTSTASLVGVSNPASLWKHKFPTAGTAQPYRISDFRKYDPHARSIISSITRTPPAGGLILIGGNIASAVLAIFNENVGTTALDITEIGYRASNNKYLSSFYFGYVVISTDSRAHGAMSMPYTMEELNNISEGDYYAMDDHRMSLQFSPSLFNKAGVYNVYPCLFRHKQDAVKSDGAISISNGYIPLPCAPIQIETAYPASVFIMGNLSAGVTSSYGGNLIVRFRFTNKTDGSITTNPNMTGYFVIKANPYTTEYPSDDPDKTVTTATITETFTCPANSSIDISYTTSIYAASGTKFELQVLFYWGSEIAQQVSSSSINPFA